MKKTLTILAIACIAFIFAGCQKDGVYNPSKKISKIYYTTTSGNKLLDQIWTWNGKLLDRIDFYSGGTVSHSYNFTYDGNRLTRMNDYKLNEYVEYKYDGNHLSETNVFSGGNLRYIYKFSYKSGKLESMTLTSTSKGSDKKMEINPLTFMFGPEISQCIEKAEKTHSAKNNGKSAYIETYKFTWEKGEISKLVISYQGDGDGYEEETFRYTYDKKNNPFFGSFISPEYMLLDGCLCKHNVTKIDYTEMEDGDIETWTSTYDYSYNKNNYPISKRETEMGGGQSYTGGLYEYEYLN